MVLAFRSWRQEDQKVKVILAYTASLSPAWSTWTLTQTKIVHYGERIIRDADCKKQAIYAVFHSVDLKILWKVFFFFFCVRACWLSKVGRIIENYFYVSRNEIIELGNKLKE